VAPSPLCCTVQKWTKYAFVYEALLRLFVLFYPLFASVPAAAAAAAAASAVVAHCLKWAASETST